MFGIVRQQPIGFAGDGRKQHWDILGVADQVPARRDQTFVWIGNEFRIG